MTLADQLHQISTESLKIKQESGDPKILVQHQLHRKIKDILYHEASIAQLEKEATQGRFEIHLIDLDPLIQLCRNKEKAQQMQIIKNAISKENRHLKKKGFHLRLYTLWFQRYITLSWEKDIE